MTLKTLYQMAMDELKQLQAAAYVLGDLEMRDTIAFEESIDRNEELARLVSDLHELSGALMRVAPADSYPPPPNSAAPQSIAPKPDFDALFDKIVARLEARTPSVVVSKKVREGTVVTDREGRILWINDAFTAMCGYKLPEVIGKKPGHVLQGKLTDRTASENMRRAVRNGYGCVEELINYHKNGDPYWVRITITPVLDHTGQTAQFIALEEKLEDRPIPLVAA